MTGFGSHRPHDGSEARGEAKGETRGESGPEFDGECARIEAALAESERGRRFLAAYAHRHRGADTQRLLQAIGRLESAVVRESPERAVEAVREERAALTAMAEAVAAARAGIGEGADGPRTFEAAVQAAETTTSAILAAAEAMQEAAWTLRETGVDERLCDLLDRKASAIGTACAAQDRITQAGLGIARTLSLLETRLAAALAAPSVGDAGAAARRAPSPHGPAPAPIPAEDEIDFVAADVPLVDAALAAPPADIAAVEPAPSRDDLATAFADLDRLSIEEKIALFS